MPVIKGTENGGSLEPVSPGIHNAICAEYVDLGMKPTRHGDKWKGCWILQVEERHPEDSDTPEWARGKRKEVRVHFNHTVGSDDMPSALRKMMGSWRGKKYQQQEVIEKGIDPAKPAELNMRATVNIVHSDGDGGRVWANVDGIMPASKDNDLELEDYMPVAERARQKAERDASNGNGNGNGGGGGAKPPASSGRATTSVEDDDVPF